MLSDWKGERPFSDMVNPELSKLIIFCLYMFYISNVKH